MEGFTEESVRKIAKIPKRFFLFVFAISADIKSHRLFPLATRRVMPLFMILRASLLVLFSVWSFNGRKGGVRWKIWKSFVVLFVLFTLHFHGNLGF